MNDRWSERQTLGFMFAGTATAFILWLMLLYWLWPNLPDIEDTSNFWSMVGAMSSAVTAAALIGGGLIAYRQLVEGASTRYIDVADRLFSELNSEENTNARRWIFQNLAFEEEELEEIAQRIKKGQNINIGKKRLEELTQIIKTEGQEPIKQTLNSLDRVAFLTQSGWIPEEIIMPWMNPMIVKSWLRLKPYVETERKLRDEPDYYIDAGKLGDHCVRWRFQKYGDVVSKPSPDAI